EIAALIAPKPLLLVSCGNDWTKYTPTLEYPFIQRIYNFYNAEEKVQNVHFPDEFHDYGPSKRNASYFFFAEHLNLNISNVLHPNGTINEAPNTIENKETMYAITESFPLPSWALNNEDDVLFSFRSLQN
ncbi:MAG: acetylxylan esterase, partial [Promethearchaeota archaeon]